MNVKHQLRMTVLGSGSWGSVLADVLARNGHAITIYGRNAQEIAEINRDHTNTHYIPNLQMDESIVGTTDLREAVQGAAAIFFVIPTQAVRPVAEKVGALLSETGNRPFLISAAKGLEEGTLDRISQILTQSIPQPVRGDVVILSGPSHAEDVAKHDITTLTAASENEDAAAWVQWIVMNDYMRIYTSTDVTGVELGGAIKNVIAIGAGAIHGLGYGDNTKAALMTRGLAEMARLGVQFGADPLTFSGLSGLGDLIVTCTSTNSRNWRCGDRLGRGEPLEHILATMGMVVEGVPTAQAVHTLSAQMHVDMPICDTIYQVLYRDRPLQESIDALMQRIAKPEIDF
ncbi:MAG: NAD(P)H-dependent glycerol-3-phosphate dehydrogenase [Schleiferilactobacillus perolens]|jgi:glycerol-3-phosphate dehydrogenase (NAD(P)+)|uniref:NAD(P)H-dependent glycerol-3-phosphate dehydrogenase n=1 Tax=Schleiferilactobacillus perolens TaxID=100468 RepID=UPI0039E98F83